MTASDAYGTDYYGYRKKFAALVPSTNTAVEHEYHMMKPKGVVLANRACVIPPFKVETEDDFVNMVKAIGEAFGTRLPLVHNLVEGGNSPVASSEEMVQLNYKVALYPVALLHQFIPLSQQLLQHIKAHGRTDNYLGELIDLERTNNTVGASALLEQLDSFGP